ncbi:MAG: amidohydrolase family protein [Peptococcaceae bacterium]|jgi:N-acyl-D-amino-acid deacylase|nr:amidohydrolase family protein [Peptococcaceae bacterium]
MVDYLFFYDMIVMAREVGNILYDLVLKNGLVVDPGNRILSELRVGVDGGRIVRVTAEPIKGRRELDCGGLAVAPGFVDIHAHEDKLTADGDIEPVITQRLLRQGVTTFIGGQCGIGPEDEDIYRQAYDQTGQPVNCALLTAHGSLRELAGAEDKYAPVSDGQLGIMERALRARLAAGSYGLSFGIRYIPGMDQRELLALTRVVRLYGGIVAAHIRDDCAAAPAAAAEFLEAGRQTGARLQISHIGSMAGFGQMGRVLALIDDAAAEGVDVMVDCYPYNAFCTYIGETTYDGDFLANYGNDITKIEITDGEYRGRIPSLEVFQRIRREHPEYLTVAHVMLPGEIDMALLHPRVLLGSDGILVNGAGHPRAAGAFPRFIRQYVTERRLLSLYQAIEKMSWLAANRLGLPKGRLSPGWDADLVVFDPARIRDNATYSEPGLLSAGFKYIILGGKIAVEDDVTIDGRLGRALLRQRY